MKRNISKPFVFIIIIRNSSNGEGSSAFTFYIYVEYNPKHLIILTNNRKIILKILTINKPLVVLSENCMMNNNL